MFGDGLGGDIYNVNSILNFLSVFFSFSLSSGIVCGIEGIIYFLVSLTCHFKLKILSASNLFQSRHHVSFQARCRSQNEGTNPSSQEKDLVRAKQV